MLTIPAMRGISKYMPFYGCTCVLCRLKFWNTFIGRRFSVSVPHQHQNRTINFGLNDFIAGPVLGWIEKQPGYTATAAVNASLPGEADRQLLLLPSRATMAPQENPTCAMRLLSTNGSARR